MPKTTIAATMPSAPSPHPHATAPTAALTELSPRPASEPVASTRNKAIACSRWKKRKIATRSAGVVGLGMGRAEGGRLDWARLEEGEAVVEEWRGKRGGNFGDERSVVGIDKKNGGVTYEFRLIKASFGVSEGGKTFGRQKPEGARRFRKVG